MFERVFPGNSELAVRMRGFDWANTDLGAPQDWPENLQVALGICLASKFPMQVWWGPRLTLLYNDATISLLGAEKHPAVLGRPAREAWPEASGVAIPLAKRILTGRQEANWCENVPLFLSRHVPNEEVYVTVSLSPIFGAEDQVDGIFAACTETTDRVIGARRLDTLRRLGIRPAEARTASAACKEAVDVLAGNPRDIPFVAIYLIDEARGCAELCAMTGESDRHQLPGTVWFGEQHSPWPLGEILRSRRPLDVDLRGRGVTGGYWNETITSAVVIPISGVLPESLAGFLVAGTSPRMVLDDAYRKFFQSVAEHVATVIREATAYADEQLKGEKLSAALEQSDLRYRELFSNIHEALIVGEPLLDASGSIADFRIRDVNPAFGTLTGQSDAIGRTMRELSAGIEPEWIEDFANVVRTGGSIHTERYTRKLDRWFEIRASISGDKQSPKLVVLARNITKRKRADQTAAQLMQKLTSLVENTPLAVVEWDADFVVTRWSGHAEKMFGWTARETVGKRIKELPILYEADVPKVDAAMARLLDPANSFVVSHNRNNTKGGRVLTCEWYNSVIHDESGAMVAVLSLVLDVSERVYAEAALREREARSNAKKEAFQLAISGAPLAQSLNVLLRIAVFQAGGDARAAFFVVCPDGTCLRAVPGATTMPASYIAAVDGFKIAPDLPACGTSAYYGQPVTTADVERDALWSPWLQHARDADFRACWSFPMKPLGGRILGTFAMYFRKPRVATQHDQDLGADITHSAAIIISRYHEVEEREAAEAALRDADRRKDEFLAALSHELRNPLAPIRAAVDVMRHAGGDAAITGRARETIARQLSNLTRLVDDLLDVSRITRNKVELRKEHITLSNIVEGAVETSRPLLDEREHTLAVDLPESEIWLHADPVRMTQVISNLLNNAARYTERGGHITLTAERKDDQAIIRVCDDGIGIPQDMLPRIFDIFTQLDTGRGRDHGGLGMGLTIVRRLVAMHGGSVTAASEGHGRGSEFTVRLPVSGEQRGSEQPRLTRRSPALPTHRILVVDDNRDAADSLRLLLEAMGNEVHVAYDGNTALEEVRRFRPSLLFLDIGLPGMSGYDVARRLRENTSLSKMVLVAITSWGGEDDVQRSAREGFDFHLTKPVDLAVLQELLRAPIKRDTEVLT
jgi:PAS domain S-box-containing protein